MMLMASDSRTHLSMGISLDGSMDERLERASESRREGLRLPGWCAMVSGSLCAHGYLGRRGNEESHVEGEDEDEG